VLPRAAQGAGYISRRLIDDASVTGSDPSGLEVAQPLRCLERCRRVPGAGERRERKAPDQLRRDEQLADRDVGVAGQQRAVAGVQEGDVTRGVALGSDDLGEPMRSPPTSRRCGVTSARS